MPTQTARDEVALSRAVMYRFLSLACAYPTRDALAVLRELVPSAREAASSFGARVETKNGSWQRARTNRIDQDDDLGTAPRLDQRRTFAARLDHLNVRRLPRRDLPRRDQAHRVVRTIRVAHADDENAGQAARVHFHARSTSSFKKCVAHEMHGS